MENHWNSTEYSSKTGKRKRKKGRTNAVSDPKVTSSQIIYKVWQNEEQKKLNESELLFTCYV